MATRGSLAYWTGAAGIRWRPGDQFADLLPGRGAGTRPRASSKPWLTRGTPARCTGEAGNAAAAAGRVRRLLAVRARVVGPEQPDTLAACGSLAYWTEAAEGGGGRDGYAELLPTEVRARGPETAR